MRPLFFILFLFFATGYCTAAGFRAVPADTLPKTDHRLNKEQFMQYYGTNDTLRAVIEVFFRYRGSGIRQAAVTPVSIIGLIGARDLDIVTNDHSTDFFIPVFSILVLFFILYIGIPISIGGTIRSFNYSRKRLLKLIQDYQRGIPWPQNIMKKVHRQLVSDKK